MDVLKCSITPTTANRFSRLNIASCRADLLLGSPHSMLEDQRRFSKELNDVDLIVYYVYHVWISLDVAALFEFHLSTLCSPFLTSIHKSKSVADLVHQSQPNIRDHFPPHTCQVSIQSNFHISQLSVFFQNLSKLFKNHSRGGLRARLLHRRALLSKSIFF